MEAEKTYGALDRFRLWAAMLVIAIHTSPLTSFSGDADFFLTRILARIAVPFFLMVTGQFVIADILEADGWMAWEKTAACLKKLALLYGISIILYLPAGLYAGHYNDLSFYDVIRMLIFDGTFYHLWYFPACILGVLLIWLFSRFLRPQALTAISILLYLIGLGGDSYYGFMKHVPALRDCYDGIFAVCSHTRNGLFFAPLFLLMGAWMKRSGETAARKKTTACLLPLSFLLMTFEGFWLHSRGVQRHDSMYVMLVPTMFFLYPLLMERQGRPSKAARSIAMDAYILHPLVIIAIRLAGKTLHLTTFLVDNSLIHYIAVLLVSFGAALVLEVLRTNCKKIMLRRQRRMQKNRAWIELDRKALAQNVAYFGSILPEQCQLMPAVKANAYGHGAVLIARELNRLGIRAFCVANIEEGIELRRRHIRGEILILGYTHPRCFPLLRRYRLTQTVLDYHYGLVLNRYGKKLHVHVGIDTGMRRLGEPAENVDNICRILELPNLIIDGMFTHLSSDDVMEMPEITFTKRQSTAFYRLAGTLQEMGYELPRLHMQSSYSVLNYPQFAEDYARIGIALYGVLSTQSDTDAFADRLSPVLSVKARVASVRRLMPGETAGYGMAFVAEQEMRIAAVAIGYADGLPRSLSNGVGYLLIRGCRAPIIGRICMDQTLVDVSRIPQVRPDDIAVVIGASEAESISAAEVADRSGTITNEILSRLGQRLTRPKSFDNV